MTKALINSKALRVCMSRQMMDQQALAEKSGVSRLTLNRLVAGDVTVKLSTVGKLARALDVDVEEIADFDN